MIQFSLLLIYLLMLFSMIINLKPTLAEYLAHQCSTKTMFVSNTQYQTNLNTLFQYLVYNATNRYGYHNATVGVGTNDVVYGNFLCRADQSKSSCLDCVTSATDIDLPKYFCPNRKVAVIWYDECMVRYSNESFYGIWDENLQWGESDKKNVTGNVSQFMRITNDMLINISSQAAAGGSDIKYATGAVDYSSSGTVFGLVQCTPDLSNNDCRECLGDLIATFPIVMGSRLFWTSCNARFETYQFFDGNVNVSGTVPQSLPPLPPPTTNETETGTETVPPQPPLKGNVTEIGTGTMIISRSGKRKKPTNQVVAIVVVLALLGTGLLTMGFYFIIRRSKSKKNEDDDTHETEDLITRESLLYTMATLETATNGFSNENKLGQGGFGSVYKGTLPNGQDVAVKRLSGISRHGAQEFKNEILLVAKLYHKNLARLLGFALNEKEKLLVYEYVPNKSLDNFIIDLVKRRQLNWRLRYKIIQGIAQGMLYLHQDSGLKIIHRDLKASNILLDAKMNPKIADFGLARMFDDDKSQSNTSRVVGTYGYMSPEYATRGLYSTKSDAYSFGILMLEIISGKINSAFPEESYGDSLVTYAWKLWRTGEPLPFVDATIRAHARVMKWRDVCTWDYCVSKKQLRQGRQSPQWSRHWRVPLLLCQFRDNPVSSITPYEIWTLAMILS